jgi:hypothetical protein
MLESINAFLNYLTKPSNVAVLFLLCLGWLLPALRSKLPVHGRLGEYADLGASLGLLLSGASLAITSAVWTFGKLKALARSPERRVRAALRKSKPIEKLIVNLAVSFHWPTVPIDLGTAMAAHMQELRLIQASYLYPGNPKFTLDEDVRGVCTANPKLAQLSATEEESAWAEIGRWEKDHVEAEFFRVMANGGRFRAGRHGWLE